jgi:hypothetical protein
MEAVIHSASAALEPSNCPPIQRREDTASKTVEWIQRGRLILEVAKADLDTAGHVHGSFHATTWFFRNSLAEARLAWERLRAEFGTAQVEAALKEPPATMLILGESTSRPITLILIASAAYRVERFNVTQWVPRSWRLTRQVGDSDQFYDVCRLPDSTYQCECADWIYQDAQAAPPSCKHIKALRSLGWL